MKHVVIVGATDGIGLALARLYLARGWRLGILGRDPAKLERVAGELYAAFSAATVVTGLCDVRERDTIEPAFDRLLRDLGQMDLFVYCAGLLIPSDGVTSEAAADLEMLDVNFGGALHLLGVAANYFRLACRGDLAAIGSIAGDRGRKGNPAYNASKAALHTYLEGLRNRLHPYGVRVSTIKPGFVRTKMLAAAGGRAPLPAAGGWQLAAGGWPPAAVSPDHAARLIARGLGRGREVFYVPWWWGLVALVLRATPRFLFKRFGPP